VISHLAAAISFRPCSEVGSHIADACVAAGHQVVVIDDLSTGHQENVNPHARFHKMADRDLLA